MSANTDTAIGQKSCRKISRKYYIFLIRNISFSFKVGNQPVGNSNQSVGNLSLKGCVGDSRLGTGFTTANCIANRFGVNAESTGATLQRRDRPPI
jgi:hypothetical protein